jgi:DNA polymerase-3 subunit alpha
MLISKHLTKARTLSFVHLRVHSTYSLAEGAIKIPPLIDRCRHMHMAAVAVTDTCNLFGAMEFSLKAAKEGVQPIIGCQLNLMVDKDDPRHQQMHLHLNRIATDHLILLVQNEEGYKNLLRMVSQIWRNAKITGKPYISFEDLNLGSEGLLALTGGYQGGVGQLLVDKQKDASLRYLKKLEDLFPDRLYMELSRLGYPQENAIEEDLIGLAYERNLPLVATNEAFFLDPDMHEAHDALLCIADGVVMNQEERRAVTASSRLKSPHEMEELFADLPEALLNTEVIAKRCGFMVTTRDPILPAFPTEKGDKQELRDQAAEGLKQRLINQVYTPQQTEEDKKLISEMYFKRLESELNVIISMGFAGYFLIVSDFIKWAKNENIPVGPGRGSGAGSLVAWSLTITDIDPIRFGLIFERFLNPERVSMPDFDIDFCQDRRDEVIEYVSRRYGADRVAQIITFGKMQARAVLRDVGRVLQMPLGLVDRICKMIPNNPAAPVTLQEALDQDAELRTVVKKEPGVYHLFDLAKKLEGLYRHASTHAAGVVIGDRPLQELVALYYDPRSELPATQFNMKDVEKAGLVKFDFLGLKTLTVIQRTIDMLAERGIDVNLQTMPLDDPATFALLNRCETVGVFQFESTGMVDVLRRLRPSLFDELIALAALYRPGPMDDIPRYLACKHGQEEVHYLHPALKNILQETFGVMVYQEQVMMIAQVLAGYSLGGADLLRRAMGKKIQSEMDDQQKTFIDGAVANGVEPPIAAQIFEQAAKFASYGFNKSHSAPYALIAYQTAYLKANYPLEFMASVMTLDLSDTDKLNIYRQELDKMNVSLFPPDVNASQAIFSVEPGQTGVRYGLAAIKNIGAVAMESIVAEREKKGPYKDIWDFFLRVDAKALNKRQVENLIVSGAFDSLHSNRRELHESVEMLLNIAGTATNERTSSQKSLFGMMGNASVTSSAKLPTLVDWKPLERLEFEFAAIGFYLTAHPLDAYIKGLQRLKVVPCRDLEFHFQGAKEIARVAGVVLAKKVRTNKQGKKYAFISVSDPTGVFEFTVFSEHLLEYQELLVPGKTVYVTVGGRVENESLRLTLISISDLEQKLSHLTQKFELTLSDQSQVPQVQDILKAAMSGQSTIHMKVPIGNGKQARLALPGKYRLSAEVCATLSTIHGLSLEELDNDTIREEFAFG